MNGTDLTGTGETTGVLLMDGTFTGFSFTGGAEYWYGFTFGGPGAVSGEPPAPVPVPAAGLLLAAGLAGMAGLRRRRRA